MADIRSDLYDGSVTIATSGAPTWTPAWQPENIDDVTYHHETLAIASPTGSDILTQNYTGSPAPPTPGTGGYYWTMLWFMWKIDDGSMNTPATPIAAGDIATAELHFILDSFQEKDGAALEVWLVPRFADPPGSYGSVDPASNACSQRDWTLSDGSMIGSEAGPFYTGEHIIDVSSGAAAMATAGEFSLVLRLASTPTPSGDPTSTYEYLHGSFALGNTDNHFLILGTTPPPITTPPVQTGLTASGTSDCQARFLPELAQCIDAELQRRRWPSRALTCEVPESVWQTTREGDTLPIFLSSVGLKPRWVMVRVAKRSFSERDGRFLIDLQHLDIPDGRGRRFQAARTLNTYNPRILDDMAGVLLANDLRARYLLMIKD